MREARIKLAQREVQNHAPVGRRRKRRQRQVRLHNANKGEKEVYKMTLRQSLKRRDRDHAPVIQQLSNTAKPYDAREDRAHANGHNRRSRRRDGPAGAVWGFEESNYNDT